MGNNARDRAAQEELFASIFSHLREQDIEQFYAHYQLWVLRRRVPIIEQQIETMREHLAEHQLVTEALRPSALALAVLVRLQSNGVNDIDTLDLMLERGEDWLDRMMQRLDYCEQVQDFIQGDYTQWCQNSLEGAYDWIDSLLGSIKEETAPHESVSGDGMITEELLLQKLSIDDEKAMLEMTLDHPAMQPEAVPENKTLNEAEAIHTAPISLPAVDTSEPENDVLSAQPPEFFGWKDLEDLEAPESLPVPWYSVNVDENGTTSSLREAVEQTSSMNDWIDVLQADSSAHSETEETEAETLIEQDTPIPATDQPEALSHVDIQDALAVQDEETLPGSASEFPGNEPGEISAAGIPSDQPGNTELEQAEVAVDEQEPLEHLETDLAETPTTDEEEVRSASGAEEASAAPMASETAEVSDAPESGISETANMPDETDYTMARDSFDLEESVDEQRAWYEYLEAETATAQSVSPASTERETLTEDEEATPPSLDQPVNAVEQDTSASALSTADKLSAVAEPQDEGSAEKAADEEKIEIEGWQTWESRADVDDEKTLPLALKEIQITQQPQIIHAPHPVADEIAEPPTGPLVESTQSPEDLTSANNDEGEPSTPIGEGEAHTPIDTDASDAKPEIPASDSSDQNTLVASVTLVEYAQASGTGESSAETFVEQVAVQHSQPIQAPPPPAIPAEKPPKKPGFWQRLFGFMRGRNRQG